MHKNEKSSMFLIEKLDSLEWDMKLLNTSITITHTPLRTLMSLIKAEVVLPSRNLLRRVLSLATLKDVALTKHS